MLTPHLLASCGTGVTDDAADAECAELFNRAGGYFHGRAAYSGARPLYERALAIREKALGPEHPDTGTSISNLALLLKAQSNYTGAHFYLYQESIIKYILILLILNLKSYF